MVRVLLPHAHQPSVFSPRLLCFRAATLTNFFFPVLLVRPRWVTHDSCTARNNPAQRYGGDWLPRCAMNNMPGCGKEDQDELAIAVANAGPWAPARQRARN